MNAQIASHPCLLEIEDLSIRFAISDHQEAHAVKDLGLRLDEGESVGVIGESGSGKTTMARAVLRLLPQTARVRGSIRFRALNLLRLKETELRRVRGKEIALVQQSAERALHPVLRVIDQIAEVIRSHRPWSARRCREEANSVLRGFFGPDSSRVAEAYPHQLSGGQRQRIVFAQAIACSPDILIADEPTASLDTITQAEILDLLAEWKRGPRTSLLFITHDPGVAARISKRLVVMYAGQIVETGPAPEVLRAPAHPYTQALLRCRQELGSAHHPVEAWPVIPGDTPDATVPIVGCSFLPRCDRSGPACSEAQALVELSPGRQVRCVRAARG